MERESIAKDIFCVTKQYLEKTFESFSKLDNIQVVDVDPVSIQQPINYKSEIIIYGADLTLRLQIFYKAPSLKKYLSKVFDEVTDERVCDFLSEVCNLAAGKLKEHFVKHDVVAALSLPVVVSSSLEKIHSFEVLSHVDFSCLKQGENIIACSKVSLEIHNTEKLKKFDKNLELSMNNVEFFN